MDVMRVAEIIKTLPEDREAVEYWYKTTWYPIGLSPEMALLIYDLKAQIKEPRARIEELEKRYEAGN